jgi:hypothetical protein
MTEREPIPEPYEVQAVASALLSEEFLRISDVLEPKLDRALGYRGTDRFVLFYYEPRGQEVMWQDAHSYGFAIGGWQLFLDQIAPLMDRYGVSIGSPLAHGCYALVVDRLFGNAYFAPRKLAKELVLSQVDE